MVTHKKAAGESGSIAKQSVMPIVAHTVDNAKQFEAMTQNIMDINPNLPALKATLAGAREKSGKTKVASTISSRAMRRIKASLLRKGGVLL